MVHLKRARAAYVLTKLRVFNHKDKYQSLIQFSRRCICSTISLSFCRVNLGNVYFQQMVYAINSSEDSSKDMLFYLLWPHFISLGNTLIQNTDIPGLCPVPIMHFTTTHSSNFSFDPRFSKNVSDCGLFLDFLVVEKYRQSDWG